MKKTIWFCAGSVLLCTAILISSVIATSKMRYALDSEEGDPSLLDSVTVEMELSAIGDRAYRYRLHNGAVSWQSVDPLKTNRLYEDYDTPFVEFSYQISATQRNQLQYEKVEDAGTYYTGNAYQACELYQAVIEKAQASLTIKKTNGVPSYIKDFVFYEEYPLNSELSILNTETNPLVAQKGSCVSSSDIAPIMDYANERLHPIDETTYYMMPRIRGNMEGMVEVYLVKTKEVEGVQDNVLGAADPYGKFLPESIYHFPIEKGMYARLLSYQGYAYVFIDEHLLVLDTQGNIQMEKDLPCSIGDAQIIEDGEHLILYQEKRAWVYTYATWELVDTLTYDCDEQGIEDLHYQDGYLYLLEGKSEQETNHNVQAYNPKISVVQGSTLLYRGTLHFKDNNLVSKTTFLSDQSPDLLWQDLRFVRTPQ